MYNIVLLKTTAKFIVFWTVEDAGPYILIILYEQIRRRGTPLRMTRGGHESVKFISLPQEGGGNPSEAMWLTEGVFLGVKILNFIIHAYSFSLTFVRQLPRGGSLSKHPSQSTNQRTKA